MPLFTYSALGPSGMMTGELATPLHRGERGLELDAGADEIGEFFNEEDDLGELELDEAAWKRLGGSFGFGFRGGLDLGSGFELDGLDFFASENAERLGTISRSDLAGDETGGTLGAVGEEGHLEMTNSE